MIKKGKTDKLKEEAEARWLAAEEKLEHAQA